VLDFLKISTRSPKRDVVEVYPKFIIKKSKDLMIRGGDFYAIWIEELGLWSTDEQDALHLIDKEVKKYYEEHKAKYDGSVKPLYLWDADSGMIDKWHKYCQKQMRDSYHNLDESLIFSNVETKKEDYATKRLNYPLEPGDISAYDELMSVLYSEEERHKIEWAIGAIVTGESKKIQKFMVLYGSAGTGKSTILNIIQKLFEGYYSVFDAKALGSSNNVFALEAFKSNPLVAIQHDGDLSRIEDNTRLNSLVSHEHMTINEKFKSTYVNSFKCFLIMGTNKPVKITDAKSGLIRRLIDVSPTGDKINHKDYKRIMKQIDFELGPIAYHCRDVYLSEPDRYDDYIPTAMLGASNDFYNFVMDSYLTFKNEDGITLKRAWEMYKMYCDDAKVAYPYSQRAFKEELKNYFKEHHERYMLDDTRIRNYYKGFREDKFDNDINQIGKPKEEAKSNLIEFKEQDSIFDKECKDCLAQYANDKETPTNKWEKITTTLSDIDTSKLHYVKVPENHIVIDFDIPDDEGNKCFEKNLEEASKWPPTYAELSKSGAGIHLHYIYTGDVTKLSRIYDDKIEVKIFTGKSSLRRMLTKCNNLPIASINSGLPLKGEKKMVNFEAVKSENRLRALIKRNLMKEIHPGTKPSVDFIYKILEDAYSSGLKYDVTDMRNTILAFAAGSTHQSDYCVKLVGKMHFKSEEAPEPGNDEDAKLIFYDCEVFPNLFLVNWKMQGEGKPVVRMINPKPEEIEELIKFKLVGFNCRSYDNHILYARMMGYSNEQLYNLSQKIINSKKGDKDNGKFGGAYNLSYTDVYDFAAKKQSLKKWEIELGIHHQELGLPWDQPVPEEKWTKVAEYCDNDVISTEAVFNHLKGDFVAREILAELAGGTVNDTTNSLTTKIIFGNEKHPQLVYTDLSETFPGYEFKDNKNMYRGEDLGKGGYIRSFPGIYGNVALLDVASLHPNSIRAMNCFGEYTKNFTDILDARVAIKHKDFDTARKMMGGKLKPFLEDESTAKDLAQALKIAINSVYGLTAANFDNPFRDIRNKNNIVALRGALFMKTLQDEVESRGFKIVAIKTDSIKIADATKEIVDFCMDFAKKYGYTFEHEATYDKICQINDADYIARYKEASWCEQHYGYVPGDNQDHEWQWTVTGAQFAVPYVFKKLFSKEEISFDDLCETKSVAKGVIYLDMNEDLPDVSEYEKEKEKLLKRINDPSRLSENMTAECNRIEELTSLIDDGHNYIFVGKVGRFCPIKPGCNGGILYRENEGKYFAVTGTKGYRWLESELVQELGRENDIDKSYYENLANEAVESIAEYGDYEWFVSEEPYTEEPKNPLLDEIIDIASDVLPF
jgi:hypothetical protein